MVCCFLVFLFFCLALAAKATKENIPKQPAHDALGINSIALHEPAPTDSIAIRVEAENTHGIDVTRLQQASNVGTVTARAIKSAAVVKKAANTPRKAAPKKYAPKPPVPKKATPQRPIANKPAPKKVASKNSLPPKAVHKTPAPKKPTAKKPTPKKPTAKNPTVKKPAPKKIASKNALPPKAIHKTPAPKKPTSKKPTVKKPSPKKAVHKKPTPKKPTHKIPTPKTVASKKSRPRKAVHNTPVPKKSAPKRVASKIASPRKAIHKTHTPKKLAVKKSAPKRPGSEKTSIKKAIIGKPVSKAVKKAPTKSGKKTPTKASKKLPSETRKNDPKPVAKGNKFPKSKVVTEGEKSSGKKGNKPGRKRVSIGNQKKKVSESGKRSKKAGITAKKAVDKAGSKSKTAPKGKSASKNNGVVNGPKGKTTQSKCSWRRSLGLRCENGEASTPSTPTSTAGQKKDSTPSTPTSTTGQKKGRRKKGRPSQDRKKDLTVAMDPNRKNNNYVENVGMYLGISPAPSKFLPMQNGNTGQWTYERKTGDSKEVFDRLKDYTGYNSNLNFALSGEQDLKNGPGGNRPAKFDEHVFMKKTPDQIRKEEKKEKKIALQAAAAGVPKPRKKTGSEFWRISTKSQKQLEYEHKKNKLPGNAPKAWNAEQFQENMNLQQQHFKNHKAGDTDDEYAKYVDEMNAMTNSKQRPKKPETVDSILN